MPPGGHPRALLLLIHGGGWKGDIVQFRNTLKTAPNYQRLGYETLTFNYRSGTRSIKDAEMFYRLARTRVGPNFPICAIGSSAGANLALLLAANNPDLACVVDLAGPTNLVSLPQQPGGRTTYAAATKILGEAELALFSPALQARSIRAKVFMVYAENDPAVPLAQGEEMARALPNTRLIVLPPGPVSFEHSLAAPGTDRGVSASAYAKALAALERFLADAASSWRRG
jgi:dienelactone hydrolase